MSDRYQFETCEDCDQPVSLVVRNHEPTMYWTAPDDLWHAVVGTDEMVLCPRCFTARAFDAGLGSLHWQVSIEPPESWEVAAALNVEADRFLASTQGEK